MKFGIFGCAGLLLLFWLAPAQPVAAKDDRYIGYYYPAPADIETYCARVPVLADMDRRKRVGFVIGVKEGAGSAPYEVPYSIFVKGGEARKLIIVAKRDGYLNSIYRVRALLADLTNNARTTPIFEESGAPEELTFLDLLTLLDFTSLTVSDGIGFTHQIEMHPAPTTECDGKLID
ncbi:MAG: molybdopterin-guanine dinucleotide biosynthesis protein A [Sneathiella sp.]|jgi:hypothetical protein|uniref:hypothetical protein n=1 Tax=Sneathiella sp. TaxID=1964365 RepID=UPI000C565D8E|nr:hypothetical protein [Sneathiella sp.]MAL77641.1 molybdopterin-guanine dinucleotide biosynthesis protein A [Sneathiella sp.]|tara:strand:+ start:266 stop:793 length:528 start_codon:yes stop_codon:yes gene_type:complete